MTFIQDRAAYSTGKKEGTYPQNGTAPAEQLERVTQGRAPSEMSAAERTSEVHDLLTLAWDHPSDARISARIQELAGVKPIAPAAMHGAATYARSQGDLSKAQETQPFQSKSYFAIIEMAENNVNGKSLA